AIHPPEKTFIVATDLGILHEMKNHAPQKTFIAAPTAGNSATCNSCAFCTWMAMNGVQGVYQARKYGTGEIQLTESLMNDARHALDKMIEVSKTLPKNPAVHVLGVA
ncbi:quinolinate synthase NadA, partial [Moraxella catarrhalis]|uniref:quinolinate synthase NadA n=1 Tax=Moraxella catarrhalis TaxID=480 RepID=UPI001884745C